jgi:hypothetical protein
MKRAQQAHFSAKGEASTCINGKGEALVFLWLKSKYANYDFDYQF